MAAPNTRLAPTPADARIIVNRGQADILTGIQRHQAGDWGDLGEADRQENNLSLDKGFRLFSVYHDGNGTKFYIITEWDRSVTTVLLPEDY